MTARYRTKGDGDHFCTSTNCMILMNLINFLISFVFSFSFRHHQALNPCVSHIDKSSTTVSIPRILQRLHSLMYDTELRNPEEGHFVFTLILSFQSISPPAKLVELSVIEPQADHSRTSSHSNPQYSLAHI